MNKTKAKQIKAISNKFGLEYRSAKKLYNQKKTDIISIRIPHSMKKDLCQLGLPRGTISKILRSCLGEILLIIKNKQEEDKNDR